MSYDKITSNDLPENNVSGVNKETAVNEQSNSCEQVEMLQDLKKRYVGIPICLEKILLILIYRLNLILALSKGMKFDNWMLEPGESLDYNDILENEFNLLDKRLKLEYPENEELNGILNESRRDLKNSNTNSALESIESILKKIRPLDIVETSRLVKMSLEAVEMIKDKDVIFLLGKTGSGKSTTIHFLAGSQMVKKQIELKPNHYIEHILPEKPYKNSALRNVTTSYKAESETRYITPIPINIEEIGGHENTTVLVCDTPGFGDTAGAEIDIANSIGIIEAVKSSQSVKPVFLFNYKDIGGRGEGIRELAHFLVDLVSNIQDNLKSFSYIFTQFPPDTDVYATLLNIKDSIKRDKELSNDKPFNSVFIDMLDKTEDTPSSKLDPIKDKPHKVLKSLTNSANISNPQKVFRFTIKETSKNTLKEQIRINEKTIVNATKRGEYALVKYKIKELILLNDTLKDDFIVKNLNEITNSLVQIIKEEYNYAIQSLNSFLETNNKVSSESLTQYKFQIEKFKDLKCFAEINSLKSIAGLSEALLQNLKSKLDEISKNNQNKELIDRDFKTNVDNSKIIASIFQELAPKYRENCEYISERIKTLETEIDELLKENEFNKISQKINLAFKSYELFSDHLSEDEYEKFKNSITCSVLDHLKTISEKINAIICKEKLDDSDIELIENILNIIDGARENLSSGMLFNKKDLNEQFENLVIKLLSYFERLEDKIKELFNENSNESFKEIGLVIEQMKKIRKIPIIEMKTSENFHKTIQNIIGDMNRIRKEAEDLLKRFIDKEDVDYEKIIKYLDYLKNAEWINGHKPGTYDNIIKNIKEEIIKSSLKLQENILNTEIDLKNHKNLEISYRCIRKLEGMKYLDRIFSEIETIREKAIEIFNKRLLNLFDSIKKTFDIQDLGIANLEKKLDNLKSIKIRHDSFHQSLVYLKQQGFGSFKDLADEILKFNNDIEHKQKQIETLNKNLNEISTIFKDYSNNINSQKVADNILKQAGFETINEVDKRMKKLNNSKQLELKELESYKIKLADLKETKSKFEELNIDNKVSKEAENFLKENGYNSLEKLENKIEQLDNEIKKFQSQGTQYVFKTIDLEFAENSLNFLNVCMKLRYISIKNDAESIKNDLDNFLKNYAIFIQKEIDECFFNLESHEVSNLAYNYAINIKNRFEELNEINENYPDLKISLNSSVILQKSIEKLKENLFTLSEQLHLDAEKKKDLKKKLNLVKAFSQLDKYIDGQFYKLYREYQAAVSKEFKEFYTKIINHIENYEYRQAATELLEIDDHPVNENAFNQIKNLLSSSIVEIIEKTQTNTILMGNTLDTTAITAIILNLKRLESARNHISISFDQKANEKFKSSGYIDKDTKDKLENGIIEIENIISTKIIKYLENIETLITNDDFYEAEEKREHLNNIRSLLGNYCTTKDITNKQESIQEKLENIVEVLITKYNDMPLNNYFLNPPKTLIEKLEKVAHRNLKYLQSLKKIKETIIKKIGEHLNEANNILESEKRDEQFRLVESILWSLPEELKNFFESQLGNHRKSIEQKMNSYIKKFDSIKSTFDIKAIHNFMKNCEENGMNNILLHVNEEILKKGLNCKESIMKSLDENDFKSSFNHFKKLIDYKNLFGESIVEIDNTFLEIEKQLIQRFERNLQNLFEIEDSSDEEQISKSFENFYSFYEFKNEIETNDEKKKASLELISKLSQKSHSVNDKLTKFFENSELKCNSSIEERNISKICDSMNNMSKWNNILIKYKKYSQNYLNNDNNDLLCRSEALKSYENLKDTISNIFEDCKNEVLKFELFVGYSKERDEFYKEFVSKMNFLKQSPELKDHLNKKFFNLSSIKELFVLVENKFIAASQAALSILNIENLNKRNFDSFTQNYDNLIAFQKYAHIIAIDLNQYINDINKKLNQKLDEFYRIVSNPDCSFEQLAYILINLKIFADNLIIFKDIINDKIDEILNNFKNKYKKDCGIELQKLSNFLEQDPSGVGLTIISEHNIFKGIEISLFNQETQRHDLDYVLNKLEGDNINYEQLRENYETFEKKYKKLVKECISQGDEAEDKIRVLIRNIKQIAGKFSKSKLENWDNSDRTYIIDMMSYIFALWTIKSANYYYEMKNLENKDTFLLTPHPGQVVTILRIIGIGYFITKEKDKILKELRQMEYEQIILDKLQNNLVQVGTGEGKSLILSVASIILALLGFEVSCACYSEYLSLRDYEAFLPLFDSLDVTKYIHYGTFNKICENILNQNGDIRGRVVDLVLNQPVKKNLDNKKDRPKVLLIDEVDVFFNEDFYGNVYTPLARLRHVTVNNLTSYIWRNRTIRSKIQLRAIETTDEYIKCCSQFKGWEFLIKEAVKDMIVDVLDFKHDYIVLNDKIAYKEQDGISYDVVYGYKTLFAYYNEVENGKISSSSLEENISIGIRCGSFSYAAIPNQFKFIMGVTGTLKTLSSSERKIVEENYNIKCKTYMPSVFGENKRQFAKEADIFIENKNDYFIRLKEKIDHALNANKRAVLVFFEDKKSLHEFYNSKHISSIKNDVQVMTEEVSSSPKEKEKLIKRATTAGQITLLTKVFGRGTDFVCRDQNVISNGGVHVIQAFFSNELSEEIQIMGRTARQGKDGSFSMILLDSSLEKFLGVEYREIIEDMRKNKNTYDVLNEKRNEIFDLKYLDLNKRILEADIEHRNGQTFIKYLNNNQIDSIKTFLGERNIGATGNNDSRTVCLMDATGSMGGLLTQAKNTVGTMFERASIILKDYGIPTDCFQLQFVVYRDYDCLKDGLLEYSPWETKPDNLRKFMEKINARGGGDYEEAIEIGLWHANKEADSFGVSQVILIGDAPTKSRDQIISYRNSYGGESYWKATQFKDITFYKDELKKLNSKSIPVHAFYLHDGAAGNFKEISCATGGRCEKLNIHSSEGSDLLTNLVTEQILSNIGQTRGKGNALVDAYRSKFVKTYK